MEMPADSIAMRLISAMGKVHQGHLRSGNLDADEWTKVTGTILQLQQMHLYIDDSSAYHLLKFVPELDVSQNA